VSEPTTTSFAILSLLAVKPWTTYELAQQMERSLGTMWPRATSVVYEEPKRLVKRGLATADKQFTGNRASTVYTITAEGRRALAAWLAEPGEPPSVEHEALLKVAFADHGSLEGLRANLAAIRAHAESELAYSEARSREYAETAGPFPDRLPVIALAARYFAERNRALLRWAEWAERETADWTGVTPDTGATTPPDAFRAEST
jgi:DNA-binding PadR family transcriptional regulator